MKTIKQIVLFAFVAMIAVSCKKEEKPSGDNPVKADTIAKAAPHRIVSLNGAVTEIIAALGHEKEIAGVDVTSTFPETVKNNAKDLGHVRSVSVEAIMSLQPTLILATDKDISPELVEQLKKSGASIQVFTQEFTPEGTKKLIADVAGALDHAGYKALQDKVDRDLAAVKPVANTPKILFIYARGANMMMVSGSGTPVDKMIALAGGRNAVTDFEDYKPLTPEALVKGNPDVILLFDSGMGSLGGPQGVLKIPGVDKTTAGKNKKIIAMDGALLSGFGPRVGEGAAQLNSLLIENAK